MTPILCGPKGFRGLGFRGLWFDASPQSAVANHSLAPPRARVCGGGRVCGNVFLLSRITKEHIFVCFVPPAAAWPTPTLTNAF